MGSDWLIWQLCDSAFPCGGFAHSGGLETAWRYGTVDGVAGLEAYLRAALVQAARGPAVFVRAAHDALALVGDIDAACDAFTSNHVANRASRAQGMALLAAAARIFGAPDVNELHTRLRAARSPCHLAPVFGGVARALGVDAATTDRAYLFITLRGLVSAAVRLGAVGPTDGQRVQHRLAGWAATLEGGGGGDVERAAQTAPLQEIFQGAHDRLYSRLFQS